MANPPCMSNDGKQAVFIGTFLANGDSVALCEDHLPAFTASVTADMFGVDGQQLMEWLQANAGPDEAGDESTAAELAAPPAMLDPTSPGASAPDAPGTSPGAPGDADGDTATASPPAQEPETTAAGE
jgi:hypothetical protein